VRQLLPILFLLGSIQGAHAEERLFRVGNSLTDGLVWPAGAWKRDCFAPYVESGGKSFAAIDGAIRAGAPLSWTWNEEVDSYQGLATNSWDTVVLQTYGRMFYDDQYPDNPNHTYPWGSVTNAVNFIQLALQNNPDVQIYIYSHWPQPADHWRYNQYLSWINPATGALYTYEEAAAKRTAARAAFDYAAEWAEPYTNWNGYGNHACDYYEKLIQELEKQNLSLAKPIRMIPAGDVMDALHKKMLNGDLPGYTNIVQVYQDVPHLRPGIGRLIMAATWYAALFQESPEGLDYTVYNGSDSNDIYETYGSLDAPYYIEISPEYAALIQSTAWEVVRSHPFAGIAPLDHDHDGLPNEWEKTYFGGSTNANPTTPASNGINTVLETYIAGLNPTNSASFFNVSNDWKTLRWNATSGRVYTVSWTSNLLSGFQALETNLNSGEFTNLVTPTNGPNFYRIDVQLAP